MAEAALELAVRRQHGEERPLGPKALRTRRRLLEVAQEVIEEVGYDHASPSLITERAGVSQATFYQYFPDLDGVIAVLAGERVAEVLARRGDRWDPLGGRLGLRRVVAVFVEIYLSNLAFFRIWGRISHGNTQVAEVRRSTWAAYKHRFEQDLRNAARLGVVRADLDPVEMTRAMTLMMEAYCYDVAIFDPPQVPLSSDDIIDTVTSLWAGAIGLAEPYARRQDVPQQ